MAAKYFVDFEGLQYYDEKIKNVLASKTHSHDGTEVSLSGYEKPSSANAIAEADTVNAALGKLEKALDGKAAVSHGTHVTFSTTAPAANGTASAGGSSTTTVAKSDHVHPLQTTVSGNAGSATKLATTRAINGTNFDGSAAITTAKWGTARDVSISDSDGTNEGTAVSVNGSANATLKLPATIKASITGNVSGSSGSCTGNAATATKLATARSLWGNNFDGSAAISGTITGTPSIEFKPAATTSNNGGYLDFHYNQNTSDYTSRIIESASGTLSINNVTITTGKVVTATTFTGALSGNASTATKLATARSLKTKLDSTTTVTFDGSAAQDAIPVTGTLPVANGGTGQTSIANIQAGKDGSGNTITSTYVNLAGDQTISGTKTFSKSLIATSGASYKQYHSSYTRGNSYSSNLYWGSGYYDKNGTAMGDILYYLNTTANGGDACLEFRVFGNPNHTESLTGTLGVHSTASGDRYSTTHTPSSLTDNSTKIATTAWVRTATGNFACNAASATITKGDKGTGSYVNSVKSGNALVNADNTQFGTIFNAPTKNYRVGCATWPDSNDNIVFYSITNANVSSSTNSTNKTMTWNGDTGILTATGFAGPLTGNVTGNCSGSSGSCTGNAATATKLETARTIAISGGATGTATSFDGSGNITIPVTALDVSKASAGTLAVARGGTGLTSLDTFVRTTGNQTIAGTKTFSAEIMVDKGDKPAAGALSHIFGVTYQNTGGTQTHTTHPISVIGNSNADNAYNTGVRLGSLNGTTVVSAGESGGSFCSTLSKYDDETLYLEADNEVQIYCKCANDMATYAGPIRFYGTASDSGGTTTVVATNFNGLATKATGDADGNAIKTTYLKLAGGTMTGNLTIHKASPYIYQQNTDMVKGTKPSANKYTGVYFLENGTGTAVANRFGGIEVGDYTDGTVKLNLFAYQSKASDTSSACLSVVKEFGGTGYCTCPTPAAADNSTKIATTAFCKDFIKALSISGKTITYTKSTGTTGTLTTQDTTYSAASESAAGLMSAADKKKLNGMTAGAKAFYIKYTGSSQISCTASTWKTYTATSDGVIRVVMNYDDGGQSCQIRLTSSSGTQIFTGKHANQFNVGLGWAYLPAKNGVTYAFYTTHADTFKFYFHARE